MSFGTKLRRKIIVDCVEMDPETQERALLDGRIAVGILVLTDRPILELLSVKLLVEHPVTVALPKSYPQAVLPEIRLPNLKEQPFIGLNRMCPAYGNWLQAICLKSGFTPRIVREADGAASARPLLRLALASLLSVNRLDGFQPDKLFSRIW